MRILKYTCAVVMIGIIALASGCFGKKTESLEVFGEGSNEPSQQLAASLQLTDNEDTTEVNDTIIQTDEVTKTADVTQIEFKIPFEPESTNDIVIAYLNEEVTIQEQEHLTPTVEITVGDAVIIPVEEEPAAGGAQDESLADEPVVFADAKFESIVRQFFGNPQGDIMQSSLSKIKYADVFMGLTFSYSANPSKNERILISLGEEDYPASFEDVKYFTGLEYLSIPFIPVVDLSFIADMTSLKYLYMYNASLSDLSPLAGLTAIEELNLVACNITNINVLANLTAIRKLDLSENTLISDYSALKGLTNMTTLKLSANQLGNIDFVGDYTQLLELDLSKNNISDITPVSNLNNLKSLNLNKNNITDVGSLALLNNLQKLYLTGNPVTDINMLGDTARFTTLKYDN